MRRCECSASCWCRGPILSAFRWVMPVGHRYPISDWNGIPLWATVLIFLVSRGASRGHRMALLVVGSSMQEFPTLLCYGCNMMP